MNRSEVHKTQSQTNGEDGSPDLSQAGVRACLDRYWKTNVAITLSLLGIWAFAGLGCGILFADQLNEFYLPGTGFPLGFWFAHQGSIIVFVLIILVYCLAMNWLDANHHEQLTKLRQGNSEKK